MMAGQARTLPGADTLGARLPASTAPGISPPEVEFPNQLASPTPLRTPLPRVGWLLLGLVLLALLPRAVMALKVKSVCPDGVLYIQLARAIENGDVKAAMREMRINVYPVILMGMHRLGLEWETAGKVWGVVIASLVVLPLFGLARRQFNDRVATVACLLYIFHGKLIVWSPELIRDQTFWFAFTLSLYLMWRAAVEVRLWLFAAAGLSVALAALTRVEGLFLICPLLIWPFWRWWALKSHRGRLIAGVLVSLFIFPSLLVLINFTLLRGHTQFELPRSEPLQLVKVWMSWLTSGESGGEADARMSVGELLWMFLHNGESGLTPIFALLMFGGVARYWRIWSRRDHQALFALAICLIGGVWIHLWYAQGSSNRYYFPFAIMGTVFAALAVLRLAAWLERLIARFDLRRVAPLRLAPVIVGLMAVVGCVDALASNYSFREEEPRVGRWLTQQIGHRPSVLGTEGPTMVITYYAEGQGYTFPLSADDDFIFASARQLNPDVVLLVLTKRLRRVQPDRYNQLIERMKPLGLELVQGSQLPGGADRLLVLTRRDNGGPPNAAAASAARTPGFTRALR